MNVGQVKRHVSLSTSVWLAFECFSFFFFFQIALFHSFAFIFFFSVEKYFWKWKNREMWSDYSKRQIVYFDVRQKNAFSISRHKRYADWKIKSIEIEYEKWFFFTLQTLIKTQLMLLNICNRKYNKKFNWKVQSSSILSEHYAVLTHWMRDKKAHSVQFAYLLHFISSHFPV